MRLARLLVFGVVACSGGGDSKGTGETGLTAVDAVDDSFTARPFFPATVNLGANDEGENIRIVDLTDPSEGSEVETRGRRSVVFNANPEFTGIETFEYTVEDEFGTEDSATVEVEVLSAPSVTITSPADGAALADGTTTLEFTVEGCTVSSPSAQSDQCHLHVKIDGQSYTGDGGQGVYDSNPRTIDGLPTGSVEIALRLVTNDGTDQELRTPAGDYVEDTITVTVPEP